MQHLLLILLSYSNYLPLILIYSGMNILLDLGNDQKYPCPELFSSAFVINVIIHIHHGKPLRLCL